MQLFYRYQNSSCCQFRHLLREAPSVTSKDRFRASEPRSLGADLRRFFFLPKRNSETSKLKNWIAAASLIGGTNLQFPPPYSTRRLGESPIRSFLDRANFSQRCLFSKSRRHIHWWEPLVKPCFRRVERAERLGAQLQGEGRGAKPLRHAGPHAFIARHRATSSSCSRDPRRALRGIQTSA
eukprot:scaffold822_cov250-Pinguiococcus_pyrenoidosus.AAC.3